MAVKMTGFLIAQLRTLYGHFGLCNFVHVHHKTELLIGTNTFHPVTGKDNCYRIDPEELHLYSLSLRTDENQNWHDPGGNHRPNFWQGLYSLDVWTPLDDALP